MSAAETSIGAVAVVLPESGRWVVYLDVAFWEGDHPDEPLRTVRRRIADYPSQAQAQVAARWMERGADRPLPLRSGGF